MEIDPLAEVVTLLRPTARHSKLVEHAGAWRIERMTMGDPFYCAVLEGTCLLSVNGRAPLRLQSGDFVFVPTLCEIVSESVPPPPLGQAAAPVEIAEGRFRVGRLDGPAEMRTRIGHCSFASPDAGLLVSLLPQVVVVRGEPRFATLMQLLDDETRARRPARDPVLERLLEVLLIEALRGDGEAASATGLARGLADERLAASLRAMHARPAQSWTISELAAEAALSRSAFFARFQRTVGLAPMEYLLAWRMALAGRMLRDGEGAVEQVAHRVGYGSASSFSVAFARHAGMPPARYAREQAAIPAA